MPSKKIQLRGVFVILIGNEKGAIMSMRKNVFLSNKLKWTFGVMKKQKSYIYQEKESA